MSKKTKILCAMSGGVDSSVAAALLKKEGYDVVGVFMKFWSEPSFSLDSNDAFSVAKQVANILDIPLCVIDFKKEFKKKVVDDFLKEYSAGKTPNPCVRCNKFIKLGLFFDQMKKYGAEYVATGHYARLSREIPNSKFQIPNSEFSVRFELLKANDKNKDQSYFLYNLTQDKLNKLLFPVGGYTKLEVRELAKKFKLPVYDRKESQEVCFTGGGDGHYNFLKRHLKIIKGEIFTVEGKKIGEHNGLPFYTIGQRRGIEIGGTGPYYVVELDFKNNRLIVAGSAKHPALMRDFLICKDVNWISGQILELPLKCKARMRYGQKEVSAEVVFAPQLCWSENSAPRESLAARTPACLNQAKQSWLTSALESPSGDSNGALKKLRQSERYLVKFKTPQFAITAGQSVVFYNGDEVLGGGIIGNF